MFEKREWGLVLQCHVSILFSDGQWGVTAALTLNPEDERDSGGERPLEAGRLLRCVDPPLRPSLDVTG